MEPYCVASTPPRVVRPHNPPRNACSHSMRTCFPYTNEKCNTSLANSTSRFLQEPVAPPQTILPPTLLGM